MKVAFPTDEHHPYADMAARGLALQIVQDFDPDVMVAGSDAMDFYTVSKFDKDPKRLKGGGLQYEIDIWTASQKEWRDAAPEALFFYLSGNHEDRLRRWIWRHPELYGLRNLELPALLELDELEICYEDASGPSIVYKSMEEVVICNALVVRHGRFVRKHSAYTAKGELEGEFYSINTLTGHTHRGGSHYATTRRGVVQGVEGFCLCNLEPEYVQRPNWQHGIVLATVLDEVVHFESIPFHTSRGVKTAIWREKVYQEQL